MKLLEAALKEMKGHGRRQRLRPNPPKQQCEMKPELLVEPPCINTKLATAQRCMPSPWQPTISLACDERRTQTGNAEDAVANNREPPRLADNPPALNTRVGSALWADR